MRTDILVCRCCALAQFFGARVVPFLDIFVWDEGEGGGGQIEGERLACVGVLDVEGADSGLDEGDVFFWS
jgi:hypothetical protein